MRPKKNNRESAIRVSHLLTQQTAGVLLLLALCLVCTSSLAKADPSTSQTPFAASDQQRGLLLLYRSNVMKATYKHIVYPEKAIENDQQDDVTMRVIIDRKGNIQQIAYHNRARYSSLNKAARKAILKAAPFPAVPTRLDGETFELMIPVKFRLTN